MSAVPTDGIHRPRRRLPDHADDRKNPRPHRPSGHVAPTPRNRTQRRDAHTTRSGDRKGVEGRHDGVGDGQGDRYVGPARSVQSAMVEERPCSSKSRPRAVQRGGFIVSIGEAFMVRRLASAIAAALVGIVLLPVTVSAQSAIIGLVRDSSGGVLPGVSVEASSPALIERVRTVVTDTQGRYAIVDLRPGLYKVTFTIEGFSTFVQERIELPSNFTATVSAELRVGTLEESITVAGQPPVVDVQNAQRTTILSRQLLDAVPVPRMYQAEGGVASATKVSDQNVGGARSAVNPRLTAHMSVTKDTTIDVDGMKINTIVGGGDSHPDHNDAMTQEITVQTAAVDAAVSAGGPHLNLIPREGGNTFSGATYLGYTNRRFQFDNLTPDLIRRGLQTPDAVNMIYDANVSIGGPIKRDRLWFFASYRNVGNDNIVANSRYPDGRPGIYDQRVHNYTVRLTWQMNARNKFTIYDDYQTKYVGHLFTFDVDVATAARRRDPVLKYTGAAKWTSIISPKMMFDVG